MLPYQRTHGKKNLPWLRTGRPSEETMDLVALIQSRINFIRCFYQKAARPFETTKQGRFSLRFQELVAQTCSVGLRLFERKAI